MSSSCLSLLFADDTTLLLSHNNLRTLIQLVNIEFRKVCEFFCINKLVLHPDKTKFILFLRSNVANESVELFCNNNNPTQDNPDLIHPITRVFSSDDVPAIKFLGIFFDPDLNFKYHISLHKSKLSKALYALRTVRNSLGANSLLLLYYCIKFFIAV